MRPHVRFPFQSGFDDIGGMMSRRMQIFFSAPFLRLFVSVAASLFFLASPVLTYARPNPDGTLRAEGTWVAPVSSDLGVTTSTKTERLPDPQFSSIARCTRPEELSTALHVDSPAGAAILYELVAHFLFTQTAASHL